MKHDITQAHSELNAWLEEGRLLCHKDMRYFPIETLKQVKFTPAVINIFYLTAAANDSHLTTEAFPV